MGRIGPRELAAELTLVASLLDETPFRGKGVVAAVRGVLAADKDPVTDAREMLVYYLRQSLGLAQSKDMFSVGSVRRYIAIAEKTLSKAKGPLKDAIDAYSGSGTVEWHGQFISSAEVQKVLKGVFPAGWSHNYFKPLKVAALIAKFPAFKWSFGKEYSPCLHCKPVKTKADALALAKAFRKEGAADEISISLGGKAVALEDVADGKADKDFDALPDDLGNGVCRFWWD